MGVYYSATTIIGYQMNRILRFDQVPNCGHNPLPNAQFCPTCGSKVGTHMERQQREDWASFEDRMRDHKLPHDLIFEEDFENTDAFWIGYGNTNIQPGESEMVKIRSFFHIKTQTLALLDPYIKAGLFTLDEDNFGIWTIHIGR